MSALLSWQVGAVRITRVQELEAPGMRFIVPQATIENLATIPWLTPFLAANGDAVGSVHALLLEVDGQRLIVDTCIALLSAKFEQLDSLESRPQANLDDICETCNVVRRSVKFGK